MLSIMSICDDDGGPNDGDNGDDWSMPWLYVEVDYQQDKDPFGHGDTWVRDPFGDSVEIAFMIDSTDLPVEIVPDDRAERYYLDHRQFDPADTNKARYAYYLCGISKFKTAEGVPLDSIFGASSPNVRLRPHPYKSWSYVCLDAQFGDITMDNDMTTKTCAHELGHQFASLKHLCKQYTDDSWYMDWQNHDEEWCLMGRGKISPCTGEDLTNNPQFCNICKAKINDVKQK